MNKGFVKRSQFQTISLTDASIKTILVEGDEAYICVMNSNAGNQCAVRRQSERDQQKVLQASGLISTQPSLSEWPIVDYLHGRVSLDVPNLAVSLQNLQITTTAGQTMNTERIRSQNVGIKEYIDLKATNTSFPLNICIETVHYVPVEMIGA